MELRKQKAPGRKLLKRMSLERKWIITAIFALLAFAYGICVLIQAGNIFYEAKDINKATVLGIYGLLVLCGGLFLLGQAFIFRVRMILPKAIRKELKKRHKKSQETKPLVPSKL